MYVTRLSRSLLTSTALILLASCSGAQNGTESRSDGSQEDLDQIGLVSTAARGAISAGKVVTTACFYAPLPGAFRIYCPGPKAADDSCQAFAETVDVRYETNQDGVVLRHGAVARALSAEEADALPDACVAVDLPLLPNSGHKLAYAIGAGSYQIVNYLRFGDGTPP